MFVDFSEDDFDTDDDDLITEDEWVPNEDINFKALSSHFQSTFKKVSSMPEVAFENWKVEVHKVSSRCQQAGTFYSSRAQLVLGRVQAGKTSNFTGVIGLLSDNGFDLFIVVAGISKNLRDQTLARLEADLSVAPEPGFEIICGDPQLDPQQEALKISTRLSSLRNPASIFANQFNKRLVYVVLKEDDHLSWMNKVLSAVNEDYVQKSLLAETNVLIVDDEVDQASPDPHTRRVNQEGAIHSALASLRNSLPTHTYLGYTATPYANLLMSESDALRCQIVSVLDAGPDYIGAEDLFIPAENNYASEIYDWDFDRATIPKSLRHAYSVFMIQAAILNCPFDVKKQFISAPMSDRQGLTPTSMLIHAHQETAHSTKIFGELTSLKSAWVHAVQSPPSPNGLRDLSYNHLWENDLIPAINQLGIDESIITPEFRSIVETIVLHTEIREINGPGRARGFEFPSSAAFDQKPAWVLIGGQLLDRGQTLPTLVNTYMPRSPGGSGSSAIRGNVDTIQQRGRFYGQRRQYKSLLRGWFDGDALATYKEIARIEPSHINAVKKLDEAGLGIEKLMMILELGAGNLALVRSNVVPADTRSLKNTTWLFRQTHFDNEEQSSLNLLLLSEFFSKLGNSEWTELGTHRGLSNLKLSVPLNTISGLISNWNFSSRESATARITSELISSYESNGHSEGNIVLMARKPFEPHSAESYDQFRTARPVLYPLSPNNENSIYKITGLTSSNDSRYVDDDKISIQLHYFDIRKAPAPGQISDITDIETMKNQVGIAVAFPSSKRLVIREGN